MLKEFKDFVIRGNVLDLARRYSCERTARDSIDDEQVLTFFKIGS